MKEYYTMSYLLIFMTLVSCSPDMKTRYLASTIQGHVYIDGQPAQDIYLVRNTKSGYYDEKQVRDSVKTNAKGFFYFKERTKFSSFSFMHQPSIGQGMLVKLDSLEHRIYYIGKMNYLKNGEKNELKKYENQNFEVSLHDNKIHLKIWLNSEL